jgi:hypothetical protein
MTAPSATEPSTLTTMVKLAISPFGDDALENVIVPLPPTGTESVRFQFAGGVADTRLVPTGMASLTSAFTAAAGPALL